VRPRITAELLAAITAQVPARLVRKLDAEPRLAEAFAWDSLGVTTPGGERVTWSGQDPLAAGVALGCSCLLAPRCLHRLAVAACLEVVAGGEGERPGDGQDCGFEELLPEQRRAVQALGQRAQELLAAGARAAGTLSTAELLRAIHSCRLAGLPRLAGLGHRLWSHLRDLREARPQFRAEALREDWLQLLGLAHRLGGPGPPDPTWLGTARRAYRPVGSLRLHGLFCEAVTSAAGYAGVVTYLAEPNGRLWTLSDVLPGPPARVRGAYRAGVDLGGVNPSPAELCRAGLFLSGATGSADGRLGAGQQVQAARAGPSRWDEALFAAPPGQQLDRAYRALAGDGRRGGDDLLFLHARLDGPAAWLLGPGGEVLGRACLRAPSDHEELLYHANLTMLSACRGLEVRLVARVDPDRPGWLLPLALEGPLAFPEEWQGRCNLGLDRLVRAHLPEGGSGSAPAPPPASPVECGPLELLRRPLTRVVLGGRRALPSAGVARECARLREYAMPGAAQLLAGLWRNCVPAERDLGGRLTAPDAGPLARAWLAAGTYERAARLRLHRRHWDLP
jgi:hypothetical protein